MITGIHNFSRSLLNMSQCYGYPVSNLIPNMTTNITVIITITSEFLLRTVQILSHFVCHLILIFFTFSAFLGSRHNCKTLPYVCSVS